MSPFFPHHLLSTLLELIRGRRNRNLSFLGLSAPTAILETSSTSPTTTREIELSRVALNLLTIFREDNTAGPSTSREVVLTTKTSQIAAAFESLLSTPPGKEAGPEQLNARHFRALLRAIARLPVAKQPGRRSDEDASNLKPEFVVIARRLALTPGRFNPMQM